MDKEFLTPTDGLVTINPKQVLKLVTDSFNDRLKEIMAGGNTNFRPLELGKPCQILLDCNTPDLPIQMAVKRLVDKKLQANHPFSLLSVFSMPEYLANPVAIFQSKTRSDSKVILTEMQYHNINLIVAVEKEKMKGDFFVNDIRSVYPKDNIKDLLRWIATDNLLEYCHKEKILDWLSKQQSYSAEVTKLIGDSTKIIHKM